MTTPELTKWLRENSSGDYRAAAEAADLIDRLVEVMREAVGCSDAMKLAATHPAMTRDAAAAWKACGEELESAISTAMPDYERVCREVHEANADTKTTDTPLLADCPSSTLTRSFDDVLDSLEAWIEDALKGSKPIGLTLSRARVTITDQRDRIGEIFDALECQNKEVEKLRAAIRNLRDVSGRHHSQIACERLFALLPANAGRVATADENLNRQ